MMETFPRGWPAGPATRLFLLALLAAVVALPWGGAQAPTDIGVRGHVVTRMGKPVSGVKIEGSKTTCCPVKSEKTESDDTGFFKLSDPGEVIYFRKEGFRPLSLVRKKSQEQDEFVLEDAKETNWVFSVCPVAKEKGKRVGKYFRFLIFTGAKMKKGFDVDYAYFDVAAPRGRGVLSILSGPLASRGMGPAPAEWILNSSAIEERWIVGQTGGSAAIDSRGRLKNGNQWRTISTAFYDSAWYYDVDEESASYFDSVLDSLCFAEPSP
jgi:hypothetical protein